MSSKTKRVNILMPFALACLGVGVGFLAARIGAKAAATLPLGVAVFIFFLFIPAFIIVIAIHEAGHALAGVLANFDFRMYVVGPFLWDKQQGSWKFKWNMNVNIAGGLVICLPRGVENLNKRFSIYAIGGPLASLLLSIVSFVVFRFLLSISSSNSLLTISYTFGLIAFLSLMIFIITVVPIHVGGFSSDGARVLRFLRGGDIAKFEIMLLKLIGSSSSGTRPKFLSMAEVNEAQELAKKIQAPMGVYLDAFAYQVAFDLGDLELAEKHLINFIGKADEVPQGMRAAVWMDAAFFYAYAFNDLTKANEFWSKFKPSAILPKAQVFATEAALASLNGQKELTLAKIIAAIDELPNMIDKGIAIALSEKLQKLREGCQN